MPLFLLSINTYNICMISLKNIKKIYSHNNIECKALDGLSLDLPNKGLVAVFGASGCGKSTLLNIIGGLDSYDSGEFIFEGKNVKEFSKREWDSYRNQHDLRIWWLRPHLNRKPGGSADQGGRLYPRRLFLQADRLHHSSDNLRWHPDCCRRHRYHRRIQT